MKRVLIIEDDRAILKGLVATLKANHFDVLTATDGEEGYQRARSEPLDLILLYLMLPHKNGQEVCRDLRQAGIHTPILMLTSRKNESDEVLGLGLGADDYMTKPFSIDKLLARIHALLRRREVTAKTMVEYSFGKVHLDFKRMEATKDGQPLRLTAKEFKLLKFLIEHEREALTRDTLLDEVWGYDNFPVTRTVDNVILNLRKQIEDDPTNPKHLLTIPTIGYKFVR